MCRWLACAVRLVDDVTGTAPSNVHTTVRNASLPRRAGRWAFGGAVVIVLLAAASWAARTAFVTPNDPLAAPVAVTYRVVEGSVGRSLQFTAVAEWTLTPVGTGAAAGVVTSVDVEPGAVISEGDVLFTVGLRPIVAAEGTVPSFRDLAKGTKGKDVAQLQRLLAGLGFYRGDIDGRFGPAMHAAVENWQGSLSVPDDGVVRAGDVVFVPELPSRIVLGQELEVGARMVGGEPAVWAVPPAPSVWIPLSREQRGLVPLSAEVKIAYGEGVWPARIVQALEIEALDQLRLILEAPDGAEVCSPRCLEWVSVVEATDFPAEIVVVPAVRGPVVPTAALGTLADGRVFVTLPDATIRHVEILGSSDGLAVVDGLDVGELILLPFERPGDQAG